MKIAKSSKTRRRTTQAAGDEAEVERLSAGELRLDGGGTVIASLRSIA